MTTPEIVVVYGTLKGMPYGQFLGFAKSIEPTFVLYGHSNGGFPILYEGAEHPALFNGHITGEAYAIKPNEAAHLDNYEGYPSMYTRKEFDFDVEGTRLKAWVYLGNTITPGGRPIIKPVNGELYWPFSRELKASKG
jgi:gamma-glutamylcyclotransferase (GGCT)/AIG2-like uncharacterized protein YtfP